MISILFVDDDIDMLKQAEIILPKKDEEFELETAISGEEALDLLSKENFDIIISDYKMPTIDGIELLKQIRDSGINIPFILLTAVGDEEVAMDALNYGADRYIIKKEKISKQFELLSKEIRQEIEHRRTGKKLAKSQQKYRDLVKNLPVGIYKTTPDGNIIDGNKALAQILGYSDVEKLKSIDAFDLFVDSEDRKKWMKSIKEKGIVENFEYKIQRPNGNIKWVEDTARAVKDEEGEIDHFNGIIRDITEIKEVEEELGQSKEWLSLTFNILDSFGDPIITTDKKGRIAFINNSTEKLFGIKKNNVVGDDFDQHFPLFSKDTGRKVNNPIGKILKENEDHLKYILLDVNTKGGKETVMFTGHPIKKKSGNIMGTIITFKNFDDIPKIEGKSTEDDDIGGLYDYLPFGVIVLSPNDYIPIRYNKTALNYLDVSEKEIRDTSIFDWSVEKERSFTLDNVKESLDKDGFFSTRIIKKYENGGERVLSFDMRKINENSEKNILLSIYDISKEVEEMKRINEKSSKYRKAYNSVDEGIVFGRFVKDDAGKTKGIDILDVNSAFQKMMGVERREIIGKKWSEILFRLEDTDLNNIASAIRTGGTESFKLVNNRTKNKIDVKIVPEKENKVFLILKQPYS